MDSQSGTADENDHFRRLRTAQAASVLGNTSLTLAANIFIAATTAWLIWHSGALEELRMRYTKKRLPYR